MIPNAIFCRTSGISRSPFFSGTSAPSTRNMGGSPEFRWMSEAPPFRAIFRMSFSSIDMRAGPRGQRETAGLTAMTLRPEASGA